MTRCQAASPLPPTSPLVIKLNNFLLFSASGCILPYLSVYYLHYTEATSIDVGRVMLLSSSLGMLVSLGLCSMADRYRAHRLVYLLTLSLSLLSYTLLLGPILAATTSSATSSTSSTHGWPPPGPGEATATEVGPVDEATSSSTSGGDLGSNISTTTIPTPTPATATAAGGLWFYLAGVCIALGSMTNTVNMSLSDSFSTNIARLCHTSFGSIRFWSSVGWVLASVSLIFLNELPTVPYLSPALGLFTLLTLLNVLLVLLWPDPRPFDLAEQQQQQQQQQVAATKQPSNLQEQQQQPPTAGTKFSFRSRRHLYLANRQTAIFRGDGGSLRGSAASGGEKLGGVNLTRVRREFAFDCADEDEFRNVRRQSLAPLGDSYVIKQYELLATSCPAKQPGAAGPPGKPDHCHQLARHFSVVTTIEPVGAGLRDGKPPLERPQLARFAPTATRDETSKGEQQQQQQRQPPNQPAGAQVMSLRLHFKIIQLIARRNPNMPRFMALFAVVGLIVANNWFYLFPYMDSLDAGRFHALAPYVMISAYLSETLFYLAAPKWTGKYFTNHAIGLSLILLVFALRYALYLAPIYWRPAGGGGGGGGIEGSDDATSGDATTANPLVGVGGPRLELIVLVELLQSVSMGWFNCLFNEAALEFALEAPHCLPELLASGLLPGGLDERRALELLQNGVKLTLLSVSSCCFDGVGVALGSLLGGWLIDRHGYPALWSASVLLALAASLANLLLEFSGLFARRPPDEAKVAAAKAKVGAAA